MRLELWLESADELAVIAAAMSGIEAERRKMYDIDNLSIVEESPTQRQMREAQDQINAFAETGVDAPPIPIADAIEEAKQLTEEEAIAAYRAAVSRGVPTHVIIKLLNERGAKRVTELPASERAGFVAALEEAEVPDA